MLKLSLLTLGLLGLYTSMAKADTYSASASGLVTMTITDPINLVKLEDVAFGSIVKPLNGTADYTVDTSGAASSTGGGAFLGTPIPGRFQVRGNSNSSVTITAAVSTCSNAGLSLQAIDTAGAPTVLTGFDQPFFVGATVRLTAAATPGAASCDFTISASY
jgi:hypothetical protein